MAIRLDRPGSDFAGWTFILQLQQPGAAYRPALRSCSTPVLCGLDGSVVRHRKEDSSMAFSGFSTRALTFYEALEVDNSKTYWTEHRSIYDACVKEPMEELLAELEPEFGPAKLSRPYRNLRFSKDKTPYKTKADAVVHAGDGSGFFYIELNARGLLCAGGYYEFDSDQVDKYRRAVDNPESGGALTRIIDGLHDAGYLVEGQKLKSRPRGYDNDHPRLELLRHKGLYASQQLAAAPWLQTHESLDRVAASWRGVAVLIRWLDAHVGSGSHSESQA